MVWSRVVLENVSTPLARSRIDFCRHIFEALGSFREICVEHVGFAEAPGNRDDKWRWDFVLVFA